MLWLKDSAVIQNCVPCGIQTYREECPFCGSEELTFGPTGDPMIDDIIARDPTGTEINLDELFPPRELPKKPISWEGKK